MIKVYCLHIHQSTGPDYSWTKEISEIKALNPDKIICFCMEEYEPIRIFRQFFQGILPWLREKDKTLTCIVPSVADFKFERVEFESSVGYYFYAVESYNNSVKRLTENEQSTCVFSCYNRASKWFRAQMIDALACNNLIKDNVVTLVENDVRRPVTLEPYQWQCHDGSKLVDEPDFQLHIPDCGYDAHMLGPKYMQGFMDIVNESTVDPDNYFMTEKTVKSIACKKPFLALSSPNYHRYLVDRFGFVLYDELFDYDFDSRPAVEDRIQGIIKNVLNLKVLLKVYGHDYIRNTVREKLEYNQQQFAKNLDDPDVVVPKSIKFMMNTDNYHLYFSGKFAIPVITHMARKKWINTKCIENSKTYISDYVKSISN